MLELAILGLLQEAPMHGYELRKELTAKLGAIRAAISYGSLYPTLRRLQAAGWITEADETPATAEEVPALTSRRGRVVYEITAEGKERFAQLIAQTGPETYGDTGFGVHFAFFSRTDQATRLRILEGRRRTIEERREGLRDMLGRAPSASTRTPWSCSATAWRPVSVRSAGWRSSSPTSAPAVPRRSRTTGRPAAHDKTTARLRLVRPGQSGRDKEEGGTRDGLRPRRHRRCG